MAYVPLIYTLISAALYAFALRYPLYTGPVAYAAFVPLLYNTQKKQMSWQQGIIWGFVFWGLHLYALLQVLIEHSQLFNFLKIFLWLALVAYFALWSTVWFFSIQKIVSLLPSKAAPLVFLVCTSMYLYCIDNYSLFLFDRIEGYPFANPLLPLVPFLFSLPISSVPLPYAPVLLLSILVGMVVLLPRYAIALLLLSIICISYYKKLYVHHKPPPWLSTLAVAQLSPSCNRHYCHDIVIDINNTLLSPAISNNIQIILMPESTIPFPLNTLHYLLPLIMNSRRTLVLGSHYRNNDKLYNCLYIFNKNSYTYYCKKHGVPFIERMPRLFHSSLFEHIFLHDKEPFTQATASSVQYFTLPGIGNVIPYICSDLFFSTQPLLPKNAIILALCNDQWFSQRYFRELMFLHAKLKTFFWQCTIIYVSHHYRCVLKKTNVWDIVTLKN